MRSPMQLCVAGERNGSDGLDDDDDDGDERNLCIVEGL